MYCGPSISMEIEPTGIVFLSVMKGGVTPEEIVSVPLCPTGVTGGRELVYIGAMVQTVQEFIEKASAAELGKEDK